MQLMKSPYETLQLWQHNSGMHLYWQLHEPIVNVCSPVVAQQVLSQKDSNWRRDFASLYLLKRMEGEGIVAVDGGICFVLF